MQEKEKEPKKDDKELTDDEIQDMVPGMGPFFDKAFADSIPFLTPF